MLYSVWFCVRRAESDISTFFHRNLPDFLPFSAAFCWLTIRTPCFHFNAGTSSFHSRPQRVRAAKKFNFILRTLSLNYPFNCFVFINALSCTSSLVPFTIHSHHCRCWMMRRCARCEREGSAQQIFRPQFKYSDFLFAIFVMSKRGENIYLKVIKYRTSGT